MSDKNTKHSIDLAAENRKNLRQLEAMHVILDQNAEHPIEDRLAVSRFVLEDEKKRRYN